jgi:hypothetical protein
LPQYKSTIMKALFSRLKRLEAQRTTGLSMTIVCGHYFHGDGDGDGDYSFYFNERVYLRGCLPVAGKRIVLKVSPGFDPRFFKLPEAKSVTIEQATPDELSAWQKEHDIHEKVIAIDLRAMCQEPPPVTEEEKYFVMQGAGKKYLQGSSWENGTYEEYIEGLLQINREQGIYFRDCDWPVYEVPKRPAEPVIYRAEPDHPAEQVTPAEPAESELDRHFERMIEKQRQARLKKNSNFYK